MLPVTVMISGLVADAEAPLSPEEMVTPAMIFCEAAAAESAFKVASNSTLLLVNFSP